MKLKHLKEKPLLELPGEGAVGWWVVRPGDERLFRESLEFFRSHGLGYRRAQTIHYMRELGLYVKVTDDDRAAFQKEIDSRQDMIGSGENVDKDTGPFLAEMHVLARSLGLNVDLAGQAKKALERTLYVGRASWDGGEDILTVHYHMRKIGEPSKVTPEDMKFIENRLRVHRRLTDSGHQIAWLHHMMKGAGISQELTEDDKKKIESTLDGLREKKKGFELLTMLYQLRSIMPPIEAQTQPQMPPIKRFGK